MKERSEHGLGFKEPYETPTIEVIEIEHEGAILVASTKHGGGWTDPEW